MKSSYCWGFAVLFTLTACGGSSRHASSPHGSKTTTTAARVGPRIEKLVVIERGSLMMIAREGCLSTIQTSEGQAGQHDSLSVRCPKPERLKTWFEGASRVTSTLALAPAAESDDGDDEDDAKLPAAKLLTTSGAMLKVTAKPDVEKLANEMRALTAELASGEHVAPGPASVDGWEMLHVTGPAHVLFAGTPAEGVLEARMSTNGQYLCEFMTSVGDGPLRASKSGWIAPAVASHAIDEVLRPWAESDATERPKTTFAAGTRGGTERRSTTASTAAVFERFASVQDALGDACLPELDAPAAPNLGL